MTEQEFGRRLRQYRQDRRMTQQELADRLGVSNKSVSRWESGGYPDVATLGPLARALGVTVDDLLGTAPPVRSFQQSDWQNLLSYAFALGGGVLFYLLDLFMPSVLCYLLYLAMMAYGVYLQRYYTYHSRWFYGANALMDLSVNLSLLAPATAAAVLGTLQNSVFPAFAGSWGEEVSVSMSYAGIALRSLLPWQLGGAALTVFTQLVVWKTGGGSLKPPRLRVRRDKVTWNKALPALGPAVLAAYFCVYWAPLLPEWFYYNQFELFLVLWGLLTAAALIFLALGRRWGMLLPAAAVHLGCLAYPGLLRWERSYSRLTGKVLADTGKLNSNAYQSFGQPSWGLLLAGVGLVLAYLLCCAVRLEAVPRVSKDGPEPRSTQ